jgi:hypothetical protein
MAASIIDEEWNQLAPENFDTTALLGTVEAVDAMRSHLNNGEDGSPPKLRTDLLKLHQLAMAVINRGARSQVAELFDLAVNQSGRTGAWLDDLAGADSGDALTVDGDTTACSTQTVVTRGDTPDHKSHDRFPHPQPFSRRGRRELSESLTRLSR